MQNPLSRASRVVAALSASVLTIALAGTPGCRKPVVEPTAPAVPRVLIVGIDGASPIIVDALFAMGGMKNLRSIADRGAYGPFKSEIAPLSPRVWTTMATGKVPEKHGIRGWVKAGTDQKADLYYGSDRQGQALWNILSDAGKSVTVVNWLVTYPPETVNGVMVSDHTLSREVIGKRYIGDLFAKGQGLELNPVQSAEGGPSAVYPEAWAPRALAPKHSEAILTHVANPFLDTAPDNGFHAFGTNLREFWTVDQRLASIALEILEEKKPDVTLLLLQGIDRVSHFLFGCFDSPVLYPESFKLTAEQRIHCQRALYDYYEFTDQLIGRLLAHFDDDDLVMVVSDHGFEARFDQFRTGGHESESARYGICVARGPRVKRNGDVVGMTVADLTPTVLDWYGLPLGADMDGKPATFLEPSSTPQPPPIDTYDTKEVERPAQGASGGESKVKEQLRSLGYLN